MVKLGIGALVRLYIAKKKIKVMDRQIKSAIEYADRHFKHPYSYGYMVEVSYNRRDPETGDMMSEVFPMVFDTMLEAFKFAIKEAKKDYRGENVIFREEYNSMPSVYVDSVDYFGTIASYNVWLYGTQEESIYHLLGI